MNVSAPEGTYPHGTYAKYTLEGCHCDECRLANNARERELRRLKAYGRAGNVDATEARQHLIRLLHTGMGNKRIAKACGVSLTSIRGILYGRPERGTGPATQIRKVTADKVLPEMAHFGGKVLRTNLTTEQEAKLQEALKA